MLRVGTSQKDQDVYIMDFDNKTEFFRFFACKKCEPSRARKNSKSKRSLRHDKTLKLFYNASGYEKVRDERVRNFLQFVYTNDTGNDGFTNRLSEIVKKLKENEKFRSDYLAMNLHDFDIREEGIAQGISQGISQGIEQGIRQKAVKDAVTLVKKYNASPETAAEDMDIPVELVLEELARDTTKC